jgi:hypothetical protein
MDEKLVKEVAKIPDKYGGTIGIEAAKSVIPLIEASVKAQYEKQIEYWREKCFNDTMSAKKSGWDDCEKSIKAQLKAEIEGIENPYRDENIEERVYEGSIIYKQKGVNNHRDNIGCWRELASIFEECRQAVLKKLEGITNG